MELRFLLSVLLTVSFFSLKSQNLSVVFSKYETNNIELEELISKKHNETKKSTGKIVIQKKE